MHASYQKKGELLLALKRYEEALASYEQAIGLSTDHDPYCYCGQGQALVGLGRYEQALVAYDQAIRLTLSDPNPQFYHEKGLVYEHLAQDAYEQEKQARLRRQPKRNNSTPLIIVVRPEAFVLLCTLTGH